MDKLSYLLSLRENNPREIYDTWSALGEASAKNKTKIYNSESIFKIEEEGPMKGALVYCKYPYTVDASKGFESIDWSNAQVDTVNNMVYFYQGVSSPNFTVLLTKEQMSQVDTSYETSEDFVPFANNKKTSSIISIDDMNYKIICAELGIPFLNEDELEYSRDTIIEICIKPAIDEYYRWFPIQIDEACGNKSANQQWEVEYHSFPENPTAMAYKAIPYMSLGGGGNGMNVLNTYGSGAFGYMRSEMMSGGGGFGMGTFGGFGNGIHYKKCVPGFVGMQSQDAALMAMAANQGYMNLFRREYEKDIFRDGKKYASGYTSLGGCLNIIWLCMDTDFNHIDYWMLPEVRKLCTAYALRNLGMLRSLVKSTDNSPLDFSMYTSRADSLEEKVISNWQKSSYSQAFALHRGGL